MRKLWLVVLCVCPILTPSKATASELNFTGMGLHDIVTINGPISGSYYAGQITWDWSAPVPNGFDPSIVTYCVDIQHELTNIQTVSVSDTNDPDFNTSAVDGGGKSAWLVNTYASTVTSDVQAAALQVAIWEALYDNSYNLTGGIFSIDITNTAYTGMTEAMKIYTQANTYLDGLFSGNAPNGQYYTSVAAWLHATSQPGGGQDQIATPEPTTLALLGLGGLMAGFRRRRKGSPATN